MKLYQNKYRIETSRLAGFDYSSPGEYFVTICTRNKVCWFGEVECGEVHLSRIGTIVEEEWRKTGLIRKDVEMDAFVIMPNHIHGIIVINKSLVETTGPVVSTKENTGPIVPTTEKTGSVISRVLETTQRDVSTKNKRNTLKNNSLGSMVGQFKSACTKRIRAMGWGDFRWHPGYYDHVIRGERDLERIREYIRLNPERWDTDDEFAHNILMDSLHAD